MSHRDVYDGEMFNKRFPDSDVERVLSGQEPEDETLIRLAPALAALHAEQPEAPSEETLSRMAAEAAEIARSSAPEHLGAAPAPRKPHRGFKGSLRRKLATLAAAMFTFAGMTGIAFAADGAAPGDTLYGVDRALEQIGVNDGATAERIDEAKALVERGQVPEAFQHLADSVESEEGDSVEIREAADALKAAAANVRTKRDSSESQAVRDSVAEMLDEMTRTEFDGATFGQRVAELARLFGSENGVGDGPPEDAGPPEDPGPPEDAGGSSGGGQGPPADSGPPEDAGPPAGARGRP